jgi:hypothetical protein
MPEAWRECDARQHEQSDERPYAVTAGARDGEHHSSTVVIVARCPFDVKVPKSHV